ncbi:long chain fatty acid CoA ligase, putative, partial [Bodo saltans]
KGVVISHGNTVACIKGFSRRLACFLEEDVPEDESYVAFLPLAHILEFAAENVFLMRGSMVGYGNPRTLTNTSARPHGDLQEFKPHILAGVPRIFDTIKKAVEGKLPEGFKRRLFDRAYEERKEAIAKGLDTPFWDNKVFAMPRQLLGGKVRGILSGGAPMSAKTQEFLMVVFGCSVGQGYGLTETCAVTTIQRYWDTQLENIGGLVSACEVKLRDVEDWKHTDPKPRGEICIRGPTVTKGYYKQPEKTAEAFSADGWFSTGDVGEVQPDGTMKIVGRVKALAKNAFGEYVALDSLESVYVLNDLALPNGVCILVDSQKAYICALVLTDEGKATA